MMNNETNSCTELTKLVTLLAKANIPFEIYPFTIGHSPTFLVASPNAENRVIDAVCHEYSYGGNKGLLEVMADSIVEYDDVLGYLTAEEAFEHFVRYMKKVKKIKKTS